MITSSQLNDYKRRAIRGKVWFKALDSLERGILSLSARILDSVHSASLVFELAKIISKIEASLKSAFDRRLENLGFSRSIELVAQSVRLGNIAADKWIIDTSFAKYITFMSLHDDRVKWLA